MGARRGGGIPVTISQNFPLSALPTYLHLEGDPKYLTILLSFTLKFALPDFTPSSYNAAPNPLSKISEGRRQFDRMFLTVVNQPRMQETEQNAGCPRLAACLIHIRVTLLNWDLGPESPLRTFDVQFCSLTAASALLGLAE